MHDSIKKASELITRVRGKRLTADERAHHSIELADLLLDASQRYSEDKQEQQEIARLMRDLKGKSFITAMTDQCFRSNRSSRAADQLNYLLDTYGIPTFLSQFHQWAFRIFRWLSRPFSFIAIPMTKEMLRKRMASVIVPGEPHTLKEHILKRKKEGVRTNLNHLGEAILGEGEAQNRLQTYLDDLQKPEIDYISVKISTLCSQLNLLAWEDTLAILSARFRELLRAAKPRKFINLDMEEYRDLALTVALFQRVMDEPEFFTQSAGIVLQSYIPDSFLVQQELTSWALRRIAAGGAPIKIRIVKGANLGMEKVEASLKGWTQAPYSEKREADANFKRMVAYGCRKENAAAVTLGIGSHNLFDIAYALIVRSENELDLQVGFEMLEGMANSIRKTVQQASGDMLLYCPAVAKEEFQNGVAYLMRRLDENTAPENFLRHLFGMKRGSAEWNAQADQFRKANALVSSVSFLPRRIQNRITEKYALESVHFQNEPDTDWTVKENRTWANQIIKKWSAKKIERPPLMNVAQIDQVLVASEKAFLLWSKTTFAERAEILKKAAEYLRKQRADLMGAMLIEGKKTLPEADSEVSEAVDFAEYYGRQIPDSDVAFKPKGIVLVASPWNFPCSIPAGGIFAALMAGNVVLFKPAMETLAIGHLLTEILWEAGIPNDVLQFIACQDEPEGSALIQDKRVDTVVLTGATATAKLFMRLRPGLDLIAETGGKNALIVTGMADRDLAIKEIVHSAFGHAGQKCSACSLAILEAEVYDDLHFLSALKDAAASLMVGPPVDPAAKVPPLIGPPNPTLLRGLTTLEKGEEWLLEPKEITANLWTPGIKLGVVPGSLSYENELFGPVLSVMRADNLEHAVQLANGTSYGLTAGLQSLDDREHRYWLEHMQAGNLYINRSITGAIVQRQPFGGTKDSSFGRGAKAGGPNYVLQLMQAVETKEAPDTYEYYWNHYFSRKVDPSVLIGQDNIFYYLPQLPTVLHVQAGDASADVSRVVAAAKLCGALLEVSEESETALLDRVKNKQINRLRFLSPPSEFLTNALAQEGCHVTVAPVLANGRLELLNYVREVALSYDYHRYGYLPERNPS